MHGGGFAALVDDAVAAGRHVEVVGEMKHCRLGGRAASVMMWYRPRLWRKGVLLLKRH